MLKVGDNVEVIEEDDPHYIGMRGTIVELQIKGNNSSAFDIWYVKLEDGTHYSFYTKELKKLGYESKIEQNYKI